MRDHDGNIVVYIGQPWCNPKGTLIGEKGDGLIIETIVPARPGERVVEVRVDKQGYSVAIIDYEKYKEWKEDFTGVPKKKEEPFNRFEIMDLEE